jgi:hypothetical protein
MIAWPILLLPAAAFVPAVLDAFRLHRTTEAAARTKLWRRRLLYAVIGMVLLVVTALMVERMIQA